jgi:hypothetical protein
MKPCSLCRQGLEGTHAEDRTSCSHSIHAGAVCVGWQETPWLAASAEDRFLTRIGRPQRFATQLGFEAGGPWTLSPVDPIVTDELRRMMGAHSLKEAKAHEAVLNGKR